MVTNQTKFNLRILLPLLVRDICLWLYWLLYQKRKLFLKFSDIFNGWQRHLHVNDSDQSRDVFVVDYYTAVYQITIGNHYYWTNDPSHRFHLKKQKLPVIRLTFLNSSSMSYSWLHLLNTSASVWIKKEPDVDLYETVSANKQTVTDY